MTKIINAHGKEFDFDAVVNLMDDETREEIHIGLNIDLLPNCDQDFFDIYCIRHRDKFGEIFEFNKLNPQV